MNTVYEQLKLENQLCFPIYAASRLITKAYQPLLQELGVTYPQYLVLMVLWECDGLTVNEIAERLILNTNTITPLLKRMEETGILVRTRSQDDERKVIVTLSESGRNLSKEASLIPEKLVEKLSASGLEINEMLELKRTLNKLIGFLK